MMRSLESIGYANLLNKRENENIFLPSLAIFSKMVATNEQESPKEIFQFSTHSRSVRHLNSINKSCKLQTQHVRSILNSQDSREFNAKFPRDDVYHP